MSSILEKYKRQLEIDKENENMLFPENSNLNENEKEAYEVELKRLRNDSSEYDKQIRKTMTLLKESELEQSNRLVDEQITNIVVKHVYCPECGEELISNAPPMFNPFTFERICLHECKKCGKRYNLEYAYPRFVLLNASNEEIKAYGI